MPPPIVATTRGSLTLVSLLVAVTVTAVAFAVGVMPAPARITVENCYVTYDRLERQHSRCLAHWDRVGFDNSGPVYGVPVATTWPGLYAKPDDDYGWEVAIPESSRRHGGVTLLGYSWVAPWIVQILLTVAAGMIAVPFIGSVVRRLLRPAQRRLNQARVDQSQL